jgi:hypothetical protein
LTTKVEINPGACQKKVLIKVDRSGSKASVSLESDCPRVMYLSEKIKELDWRAFFRRMTDNIVYKASSEAYIHATCPVPCAIIKAVEAEFGLAKKKDVKILFVD